MSGPVQSQQPDEFAEAPKKLTEVRYEHSGNFVDVLTQLRCSLLISTYQAGRLVCVGVDNGAVSISFHAFPQVMGLALHPQRLAVGTRREVWTLELDRQLGPNIRPEGRYDACYLSRTGHVTGAILGHELAYSGDELWAVNTLFSCLCTVGGRFSFVPRWKPHFISALAAEDRCHLNGMAMEQGQPRYVSSLAETDTPAGWRPNKATTGVLIDVPTSEVIVRGLSMPHSPRVYEGRLFVLDSGHGRLSTVDRASGKVDPVAELPGYTRGIDFVGPVAFVGLSKIRETNVFGGLPIGARHDELRCGVVAVDLRSGQPFARLEFKSGVDEIFAVQALPGVRLPAIVGIDPEQDGHEHVWLVPPLAG